MSLVSLAEKRPTQDDKGKTVYHLTEEPIVINDLFLEHYPKSNWYWSEPTLVDKSEWDRLKEIEKKYLADLKEHCEQFGEDNILDAKGGK